MADCTVDDLVAGSACYTCLSDSEKQAAKVWFLAKALDAQGGADLLDPNTLREAIACIQCANGRRTSFDVLITQRAASESGASGVDITVAQLRNAIRCFSCISTDELRTAETYLRCQLNDYLV